MKRLLSLILCVVIVASSFSATAFAEYNGGEIISGNYQSADSDLNWRIDADGTLFVEGSGSVPGISNTEWNMYEFRKVVIGEGITSIEDDAFLGLTELEEIEISDSVEKIGERAFYLCENLKSIDLKNVKSIGAMAFYGCKSLSEVTVLKETEEIGNYAFGYYCNEELDLEFAKYDDFKIIGDGGSVAEKYAEDNEITFISVSGEYKNDKSDLKWYVNIVEKTLVIEGTGEVPAFADSDWNLFEITKVEIREGVTTLGNEAFLGLTTLETIEVPKTLKTIGERAFYLCENLKGIDLKNVKSIGAMAFYGCKSLSEVTVLKKTEEIGNYAFGYYCNEELDLEFAKYDDFKIIGDGGSAAEKYAEDNEITFIAVSGEYKKDKSDLKWNVNIAKKTLVIEGTGKIPAISNFNWESFEITKVEIGEGVTSIGSEAFLGLTALETVKTPKTLKTIGDRAFYLCEKLSEFDLKNVTEIGSMAFYGCNSLDEITIPQKTEKIGNYAFGYYCDEELDIELAKRENFTVFGKSQTVAEQYASDNGFAFKNIAPAQPKIIFIYSNKVGVTLFWNEISGAEKYEIYRKTAKTEFKKIGESVDVDKAYCDSTVKNGETYYYAVVAIKDGYSSLLEKSEKIKFVKLDTPKLDSATMTKDGILVKWNTVKSAQGYTLYRCTEDTDWVQIADFSGSVKSFTDTTVKSGVTYYYTVKANNGFVESGYDYEGVSAVYLSIPKLTKISNASNGVKIQWGKVSGATGYIIGRKTASSDWSQIAKVGNVSSYTDKTAKAGTTYTYTVVPVKNSVKGFYDEKGLTYKYLEKVTTKSASNVNGGVKVTWSKASKGSGYLVYRKTANGSWERIAKITNLKTLQYTDKKAKSGVKYTYTVKVYSGSYSGAYDTAGKSVLYLSVPKLTKATSSKSGVTVNWGKVTGASGYYVYRKTGNGSWKKIATVKGNSKVSYLDKSAKKGTTYTYTVRAYNGKTQSSYNSTGLKIKDKY